MASQRKIFTTFVEEKTALLLADSSTLMVRGRGSIRVTSYVKGKKINVKLQDVYYVPELRRNLFSVGAAQKHGVNVHTEGHQMQFWRNGRCIIVATTANNNLYRCAFEPKKSIEVNVVTNELRRWHERLGHISISAMRELIQRGDLKELVIPTKAEINCEACAYRKAHGRSFKTVDGKVKYKPGEKIHSDVCGPMPKMSVGQKRYFVLFKDDTTGYRRVRFLRHKSDVLSEFIKFKAWVENKWERCIKVLRSNNGLEYVNKEFSDYLMTCGIEHEKTAPYTPKQNGRCERDNRTIIEMTRSMLYAKNLDEKLWAEAVLCAVYLLNRMPTTQAVGSTPFEEWTGKKLKLDHIRTFGSTAFEHVPDIKRTKWKPKAIKKIMVGYDEDSSNYRLFDPITKKMTISANAIFHEDKYEYVSSEWTQPIFSINTDNDSNSESTEESTDDAPGAGNDEVEEPKQRVLRDRSTLKGQFAMRLMQSNSRN